MRVHVDPTVCQGHTLCTLAAPHVFLLGQDDGHAYVATAEVPSDLEEAVRKAAATCPEGAITVQE
jgi:ferredoxin